MLKDAGLPWQDFAKAVAASSHQVEEVTYLDGHRLPTSRKYGQLDSGESHGKHYRIKKESSADRLGNAMALAAGLDDGYFEALPQKDK